LLVGHTAAPPAPARAAAAVRSVSFGLRKRVPARLARERLAIGSRVSGGCALRAVDARGVLAPEVRGQIVPPSTAAA
jgi:hypothetical protein